MRPSMRRPRLLGLVVSSASLLLAVTVAGQPTKDAEKRSLALYASAKKHYDEHQYELAASELRDAYELNPKATLLFNLGLSYRKLGDTARAREAFVKCASTSTEADEKERCSSQADKIDKESATPSPSSSVSAPPVVPPKPTAATSGALAPPPIPRSSAPFVLMGVGGAGLVAGAVLSVVATTKHQAAIDDPSQAGTIDKNAAAKSFAIGADVAFAAGGAAAIAGLIWAIADRSSARKPVAPATAGFSLGVVGAGVGARVTGF